MTDHCTVVSKINFLLLDVYTYKHSKCTILLHYGQNNADIDVNQTRNCT